jgi:hypothetical protein
MPAGQASGVSGGGQRPVNMISGNNVVANSGHCMDPTKSDFLQTDNTAAAMTRPEGGTADSGKTV